MPSPRTADPRPARARRGAGDERAGHDAAGTARSPGRRGVALAGYAALVAVVLLWPSPVDDGAHDDIGTVLAALHAWGLPRWVDYDLVERAANVAMFVPLGLLVTGLTASRWWGLVAPAAFSVAGELAQHLLRPERFATWTDVAANTAGAALGVLLAVLAPALVRGRTRRSAVAPRTPARAPVRGRGTPGSTASRRRRARSPRRAPSAPR